MNRHLIIGLVLIAAGAVFIIISFTSSSDSQLVIRGTNISYGWLLVILGGIRLIRAGAKKAE